MPVWNFEDASFICYFCVLPIHRFDAVIISSEVGCEKPDTNIFRAALGM